MRYSGLVATVLVTTSLAAPLPHPNDDGLSKRGFGDILSTLFDNKEEIASTINSVGGLFKKKKKNQPASSGMTENQIASSETSTTGTRQTTGKTRGGSGGTSFGSTISPNAQKQAIAQTGNTKTTAATTDAKRQNLIDRLKGSTTAKTPGSGMTQNQITSSTTDTQTTPLYDETAGVPDYQSATPPSSYPEDTSTTPNSFDYERSPTTPVSFNTDTGTETPPTPPKQAVWDWKIGEYGGNGATTFKPTINPGLSAPSSMDTSTMGTTTDATTTAGTDISPEQYAAQMAARRGQADGASSMQTTTDTTGTAGTGTGAEGEFM